MVPGQAQRHRSQEEGRAPESHHCQGQSPREDQRPEGRQDRQRHLREDPEEERRRQRRPPEPSQEAGQGIVSQPVLSNLKT